MRVDEAISRIGRMGDSINTFHIVDKGGTLIATASNGHLSDDDARFYEVIGFKPDRHSGIVTLTVNLEFTKYLADTVDYDEFDNVIGTWEGYYLWAVDVRDAYHKAITWEREMLEQIGAEDVSVWGRDITYGLDGEYVRKRVTVHEYDEFYTDGKGVI